MLPTFLLSFLFYTTAFSQALVIDQFLGWADTANPQVFYVVVKPFDTTGLGENITIHVRAEGRVRYEDQYPLTDWPLSTLNVSDWTATFYVPRHSYPPWVMWVDRFYAVWASLDGKDWGPEFPTQCCQRLRPANQKTVVLTGLLKGESLDTNFDKVLITSNATFEGYARIQTFWEVTVEDGATWIAGPDQGSQTTIMTQIPINLTEVSIIIRWNQEIPYRRFYNPENTTIMLLRIGRAIGKFKNITTIGPPLPVCEATAIKQIPYEDYYDFSNSIEIYIEYVCPPPDVYASDGMMYAPIIAILVMLAVPFFYHKYKSPTSITLTHVIFITILVTITVLAAVLELALLSNRYRCIKSNSCTELYLIETAMSLIVPYIFLPIFWIVVVVYVHVAMCCFASKGEVCCPSLSVRHRMVAYCGFWVVWALALFLVCFLPLIIEWAQHFDSIGWLIIGIIGGPIFGILTAVPLILMLVLLCCGSSIQCCCDPTSCFGQEGDQIKLSTYEPIQ